MNVYDFDNTIYDGYSFIDFMIFCITKNKNIFWYYLSDVESFLKLKFTPNNKVCLKSYANFLKNLDNIDNLLDEFREKTKDKVKCWYKNICVKSDVIITASPEFFVKYLMEDYDVRKIYGSKIDKKTGTLDGAICYNKEKYNRFLEEEGNVCYNFYTDNLKSDEYMALNAENVYLVRQKVIKHIDF